MTKTEATIAVRNSEMSKALINDRCFVEHDSVDEWADIIYESI